MQLNDQHFVDFPIIESDRLLFRQFTLDDAERIYSIRSHPQVMKYMDSTPHADVESAAKFIAANMEIYGQQNGIFWAIIHKENQTLIGDFAYWNIDRRHFRGEIGYTLHPDYWTKGYMSETLKMLLPFGFNQLGLHSIEANINPNNENSKRLVKKLGFLKEAYFRENYYYNGQFLDSEIYSLLQKDLKL